jgi:trehalose-6-phosphate synthase
MKVHTIQHGHQTYVLIDLGQEDYHEYYNGYANKVLWPILHYRLDLAESLPKLLQPSHRASKSRHAMWSRWIAGSPAISP